jgi:hypothetical protein
MYTVTEIFQLGGILEGQVGLALFPQNKLSFARNNLGTCPRQLLGKGAGVCH